MPNAALLVGVLLALCSIAVLIFFIHHVPSKLHINSVIEDVGRRLITQIDHRFPSMIGQTRPAGGDGDAQVPERDAGTRLLSARTGYLQLIDDIALLERSSAEDLVVRIRYQPGDFVQVGSTLAEIWPPHRVSDEVGRAVRQAFAIGAQRSALRNLRFLIDELVEIAARALSPGVNDPFTAVTCLDWLGAALSDLAAREVPSHLRVDDDGALRVIAHPVTFARVLDRSFGAVAPYCAGDMVAALRYLKALGEVSFHCDDPERLAAVVFYADALEQLAGQSLDGLHTSARPRARRRATPDPVRTRPSSPPA